MKTLIFAAVFACSSTGFAAATCPQGTKKAATCASTPQAGDHEVVIAMLDSITICGSDSKTVLVLEKDNKSEKAEAKRTVRAGGISYVVEGKEVGFELAMASGTRTKQTAAKLYVHIEGADFVPFSTFTCTR